MDEYLIAHCGRCGATWALEFEQPACTCKGWLESEHPDDVILSIDANSYQDALDRYPSVTEEP